VKRPAFQFYPADWRKDPALSSCSLAARGLWIELMCIAHESEDYGHLSINGKPMSAAQIARMVGEAPSVVAKLLKELGDAGVFSTTEQGCIYSRRMVADERIRNIRADAGRLGGNPNLLIQKDNHLLKQNDKQILTPSSSSSSSEVNTKPATQAPAFRAEKTADPGQPEDEKPKTGIPDCPHGEVLALWAEVLPAMPQHSPEMWRGSRCEHLRARWRETAVLRKWQSKDDGLKFFRKLFAYVGKSPFLTGQTKHTDPAKRPFVIELEWLVNPLNWAKVHEGKYHETGN